MSKPQISKLFLQSGKDLMINNSLIIKHPTIQDVFDIDKDFNGRYSEDLYYSWVRLFICDPYDYMVYLDDKKLDYEKVKPLELFIMLFQDYKDAFLKNSKISNLNDEKCYELFLNNHYFQGFKFWLNKNYFMVAKDERGNPVIGDYDTNTVMIDEEIFDYISEFIKLINGIRKPDRINPEDEFAKQVLIEDERAKLKKRLRNKKDDTDDEDNNSILGNRLSVITWGVNGGITPFNRSKLHVYDLVDGITITEKKNIYNHIMTGIYSGCVDKDKINMQQISWLN